MRDSFAVREGEVIGGSQILALISDDPCVIVDIVVVAVPLNKSVIRSYVPYAVFAVIIVAPNTCIGLSGVNAVLIKYPANRSCPLRKNDGRNT